MAIEIERKFLVKDNSWLTSEIKGMQIKQGYLKNSAESVVRIRIAAEKGFITVKGNINNNKTKNNNQAINNYQIKNSDQAINNYQIKKKQNYNLCRLEFEYEIPFKDALEMLELCEKPIIEKIRYSINFMGCKWCIDRFEGKNQGLIVAEIELKTEQEEFEKPIWAGEDVTDDSRYLNSNLIQNPFQNW